MAPLPDGSRGKVLRSWKEIAAFLRVTERSAQRWEKVAGLPVRRLGSGVKARVIAHTTELNQWLASGGPGKAAEILDDSWRGRRLMWLGLAGATALVAGLALWLAGVLAPRRVPRAWSLDGSKLTVLDARERVCWEKRFPPLNRLMDPARHEIAVVSDVDGDGRQEVLFNFFPQDMARLRSSLQCYDHRGRLKWEYRYGDRKAFGGRSFEQTYAGHFIRPARAGGRRYVVAVANHYIWYPSQFSLLDAATGRRMEEYWHPGLIQHCVLHDLDGDGDDEVLFAAMNNPGDGLGHPALGALEVPFSAAPRRTVPPEDVFQPLTGGGELAYLLFPLPDVSRVMGRLPVIADLKVESRQRILFETSLPDGAGIAYYLDFRLNVVEHRFSDNFAPLHQRLFTQRLLDHRLTPAETASLAKAVPFAAAPDGNNPELNRFWPY